MNGIEAGFSEQESVTELGRGRQQREEQDQKAEQSSDQQEELDLTLFSYLCTFINPRNHPFVPGAPVVSPSSPASAASYQRVPRRH